MNLPMVDWLSRSNRMSRERSADTGIGGVLARSGDGRIPLPGKLRTRRWPLILRVPATFPAVHRDGSGTFHQARHI